jgi:hypothetical protein
MNAKPAKPAKILLILIALASVAMAGDREARAWKLYQGNGWQASIPASLHELTFSDKQRLESPGWRHSTSFESEDGSVSLRVYTFWKAILEDKLRDYFGRKIAERTEEPATINYTCLKDNWFVVSGTNSLGFEFYTKFWLYEDHTVQLTFVYPRQKAYEPILLRFLRNFVPNLPGEWDY